MLKKKEKCKEKLVKTCLCLLLCNCVPTGNVIFSMVTGPSMSPSQIILIKKKRHGTDSSVPAQRHTKNPFDWSMGLPAQHTCVWPVKAKYP